MSSGYLLIGLPLLYLLLKGRLVQKGVAVTNKIVNGYNDVLYYRKVCDHFARTLGVPRDFLLAIISQESMGHNYKLGEGSGTSGEVGICQITPLGLTFVNNTFNKSFTQKDCESPTKSINIAAYHLLGDYQEFNDWNIATMCYNISRKHFRRYNDGTDTQEDRNKITGAGKTYLTKIIEHRNILIQILMRPNIDKKLDKNYIPFLEYSG